MMKMESRVMMCSMVFTACLLLVAKVHTAEAFGGLCQPQVRVGALFAEKRTRTIDPEAAKLLDQEETLAGVVGAEFFGGNKQKEELYDPVAEVEATIKSSDVVEELVYDRFQNTAAFSDALAAQVAESLQTQINAELYDDAPNPSKDVTYSPTMTWTTPFTANSPTPVQELKQALKFYNFVDVSLVAGRTVGDNLVQLNWEISLVWPVIWEARVLITGSSRLTLDSSSKTILQQVDSLNDSTKDILSILGSQLIPRFWDMYHIGMTPSSEIMPRLNLKKSLFGGYSVYEIPARLVSSPTRVDTGNRDDRIAEFIPNHAFSCLIKTMGPQRQRYVPASPVEVRLTPGNDGGLRLKWNIPLAVEFQSYTKLPLPADDVETPEDADPECQYEYQPARLVATVPYAGGVQDLEISDIRKQLYEKVVKDGYQPKLDADGRPQFFFLQNNVKACYTEEGLGMVVYEWRAAISKSCEIGIDLEKQSNMQIS